jgi:hypothetical protein
MDENLRAVRKTRGEPDCITGKRLNTVAMEVNRRTTTRSIILEVKERLEIGRYELKESGLRVDFLRRGKTRTCLSEIGKTPVRIEVT